MCPEKSCSLFPMSPCYSYLLDAITCFASKQMNHGWLNNAYQSYAQQNDLQFTALTEEPVIWDI